jgi:cytokinesis protein
MLNTQYCQSQNRLRQDELASRERRAAQRAAALTPQVTGVSVASSIGDRDPIDARMLRLRKEGTPRVKRERRQPAPPLSPGLLSEFGDFPSTMPEQAFEGLDFDYGTLAERMMQDLGLGSGSGGSGLLNLSFLSAASGASPGNESGDNSVLDSPSPMGGDGRRSDTIYEAEGEGEEDDEGDEDVEEGDEDVEEGDEDVEEGDEDVDKGDERGEDGGNDEDEHNDDRDDEDGPVGNLGYET